MKLYKTEEVPVRTREVLVQRKCDLCGAVSKNLDWSTDYYEVDETEIKVTIKHRSGTEYPEGGHGTEYEIDLCPNCFTERLVPWLRSQGADIKEHEWEWC